MHRNALVALLIWLGLGALLGLLERPYQWLSQLGFDLQRRLWLEAVGVPWQGAALVSPRRWPLMLLTHLAGMSVRVESPSASLGAAFRSPLLGVTYGDEPQAWALVGVFLASGS
jgi:hypothetical protein